MTVGTILVILCSFGISIGLGVGAIYLIRSFSFREVKFVAIPWLVLSVINIATLIWELL